MASQERGETIEGALRKIDRTLTTAEGGFPHLTENGRWQMTPEGGWTGGFGVGLLWLAYHFSGEERFARAARAGVDRLEPRIAAKSANFDLGFLFYASAALGYQLTGEEKLRSIALRAAERMLTFVHPAAGLIYCVYPGRTDRHGRTVGSSIMDIMSNLQLLWWASAEGGEPRYAETARRHARRTAELLLRPGGSSYQVVDFDLETGEVLSRGTVHGFDEGACWSRGHAWGIYGFALAAHVTGEALFAQAARDLSAYYLERAPADRVPYWDFEDPAIPETVRDASAAAIACAGWLRYGGNVPDLGGYRETGERLLDALCRDYRQPEEADGILARGCAYKKQGIGVDEATIWGDYYFLLALAEACPKDGAKPPAL